MLFLFSHSAQNCKREHLKWTEKKEYTAHSNVKKPIDEGNSKRERVSVCTLPHENIKVSILVKVILRSAYLGTFCLSHSLHCQNKY